MLQKFIRGLLKNVMLSFGARKLSQSRMEFQQIFMATLSRQRAD